MVMLIPLSYCINIGIVNLRRLYSTLYELKLLEYQVIPTTPNKAIATSLAWRYESPATAITTTIAS
jgi:hypothetical protein